MAPSDLVGLSEPTTALINKISDAVGVIYEPRRVRQLAKAKADAAVTLAEGQIRVEDLERRAAERWVEEEAQKQLNIENITSKAISQLPATADPSSMDRDWITSFFEKARIVTDDDMQNLWSRILAGEATSPGSFSKKTVNVVADLDKADAALFTRLCGFCWQDRSGGHQPLVFDAKEEVYVQQDISFTNLEHLASIGLIRFMPIGGYLHRFDADLVILGYFGDFRLIDLRKQGTNDVPIGQVHLTRAGDQLVPISGSKPVAGFLDYVAERWRHYGMKPVQMNR